MSSKTGTSDDDILANGILYSQRWADTDNPARCGHALLNHDSDSLALAQANEHEPAED